MEHTFSQDFLSWLSEKERVYIELLHSRRYTHKQIQKKLLYSTYEWYLKMRRKLRKKVESTLSIGQKNEGLL